MTTPAWMLLGFATWTVLLLLFTVGTYRWSRILTARAQISEFKADAVEGEDWYRRAMRAHANCIENLPVFGTVVFALFVSGTSGPLVDYLSVSVLVARILQSLVHVGFVQSNKLVAVRFSFFCVQAFSFLVLAGMIVGTAGVTR
jgi:uncharacterized MAPEG superfamily protein